MKMKFEWDLAKAKSNFKKHHVSFEVALRVFEDPFAMVEQDRIENGEYRWRILGVVDNCFFILVAYTIKEYNEGIEIIRIISARRAAPKERRRYEQNHFL